MRVRPPRRARSHRQPRRAARRAGAADRRRDRVPRLRRGRAVRAGARARGRIARCARSSFDAVVAMTADGFATRRGRRSALVHRDEVNARLRGRRGARMLAIASGGAIPEVADYRVVLDPGDTFIGTLNEDFAIESNAGDVFQLGNASWQVLQVLTGVVRVADAKGAPPTIPFWLGEAPARSDELSRAVSDLRADIEVRLTQAGTAPTTADRGRRRRQPAIAAVVAQASACRRAGSSRKPAFPSPPRNRRSPTSPTAAPRSACCRRRTPSCSSGSSTNRAACSSCCTRRSAAASTRRGAWRCASASAGSSTSSCRPRPPRTRCCCRSARSTRSRSPTSSAICIRRRRATCWCRRFSTRRCSRRAGGGTPPSRWPCRAIAAARRCRRSCSGCWPTI